ncbi:MAG: alpha/beta hydrolase, partial [Nanoarchaeota archaeon]
LDLTAAVPDGYIAVSSPFKLACAGEHVDITLGVSDSYSDYKVLKCAAGECQEITIEETSHIAIPCGDTTLGEETTKQETQKENVFLPTEIATFETSFAPLAPGNSILRQGPYSLEITGVAEARLSEPNSAIPSPTNPSLVILGNPLVIEIQSANGPLPATITMPAPTTSSIDKSTIGVYYFDGTSWHVLDSTLQDSGVITAHTTDLTALIKQGHIIFAVLGTTCNPCQGTAFDNVYSSPDTRTAVVFVHGAFSDASTFNSMIEDMKANHAPFDAWTFAYPPSKSLTEISNALADALLTRASQYDQFVIVGHSAGGLITQQAVWDAYTRGDDIHKIKKIILIGTPTEGSPAVQTIENMFDWLINQRTVAKIFNVHSDLIQASVTGKNVPRVPGIDYRVIAGIRPYGFNLDLFKDPDGNILKNDGLITVTSAQKVGDDHLDNACTDFYELNLTHTDLIDNDLGIRVTQRIIASESTPTEQARSGYTTYVSVPIENCNAADQYLVVGKLLRDEQRYDPSGCACGNGWCGEGEDSLNC